MEKYQKNGNKTRYKLQERNNRNARKSNKHTTILFT